MNKLVLAVMDTCTQYNAFYYDLSFQLACSWVILAMQTDGLMAALQCVCDA